ncbi:MAG: hypothetical protein IR526_00055 [Bordetella sp.]|nr:MAG: hypothetical protein IR526_00055 [Bordetella sp.]
MNAELPGEAVVFHPIIVNHYDSNNLYDWKSEKLAINLIREAFEENKNRKNSVAVLVRARKHLGNLVEQLIKESIPYSVLDLLPMNRNPLVSDLIQLVRALQHPGDRLSWLSLLRSPLCGFTLNTLHILFGNDHITSIPMLLKRSLYKEKRDFIISKNTGKKLDANSQILNKKVLSLSEYSRVEYISTILLDETNKFGMIPFSAWIESLWRRLGGDILYNDNDGYIAENFFKILDEISEKENFDLSDLENKINDSFISNHSNKAENNNSVVQLMTIHKSKGLQFDTIILYGLHHSSNIYQKSSIRFEKIDQYFLFGPIDSPSCVERDKISLYLNNREKDRTNYEIDRLLYVAITRAQKRVHLIGNVNLSGSGQIIPPKYSSLLGRIWPYLKFPELNSKNYDMNSRTNLHIYSTEIKGEPLRRIKSHDLSFLRQRTDKIPPDLSLNNSDLKKKNNMILKSEEDCDDIVNKLFHEWILYFKKKSHKYTVLEFSKKYLNAIKNQLFWLGIPFDQTTEKAQLLLEAIGSILDSSRGRWFLSHLDEYQELPFTDHIGKIFLINQNDLHKDYKFDWLIISCKIFKMQTGESSRNFIKRMRWKYGYMLMWYLRQLKSLDIKNTIKIAIYFPRVQIWIDL